MKPRSLFPDFESSSTAALRTRLGQVITDKPPTSKKAARVSANPCAGCPLAGKRRVAPVLPEGRAVTAIGLGPGRLEEQQGQPFIGQGGQILRRALRSVGLDPDAQGYANLTECRPPDNDFGSKVWRTAQRRCIHHLLRNLSGGTEPLLLLGLEAARHLTADTKLKLGAAAGLWTFATVADRPAFVARHPAALTRLEDPAEMRAAGQAYRRDLQRLVDGLRARSAPPSKDVFIFPTPDRARDFLLLLANRRQAWAADIESYDAKECPSRKKVATDACHPDFRLRGFAAGWIEPDGRPFVGYIDCAPWEDRKAEASRLFAPAFLSPAPKIFFNGHTDELGLTVPGWVRTVRHRAADPMLAAICLGDGTQPANSLARLTVDVLGHANHWQSDKRRMRDLPLAEVALGCAGDVIDTYRLAMVLHRRLRRGEYL